MVKASEAAVTSMNNTSIWAYYDKDRHLALGRRKLPDGTCR